MEFRQALVFAILVQDILDKAPSYLLEKLDSCKAIDSPEMLLDSNNLELFNKYLDRWSHTKTTTLK